MKHLPALLVLSLASSLAACASSTAPRGDPATATVSSSSYDPVTKACPLGVPDTRIEATTTDVGVDVAFTTTSARVVDLRARVQHQAALHGPARHEGPGHDGAHGLAHGHGLRLWEMPPSRTRVMDLPNGALLRLEAVDPATRDELRKRVYATVARLESMDCP